MFCLLVSALNAQTNRYGLPHIQNYHFTETGGSEQNWGITQDQRGLIYVANNDNGILEFDGNTWRTHAVPGNVPVRSVLAANDGFIYAGLEGDFGRLEPERNGNLQYKSLLDSVLREAYSEVNFWRICYLEDKVYSCGAEVILVYDIPSNKVSIITTPENTFLSFFIGSQLYISSARAGLMKYEEEEFIPLNGGDYFKGKSISGLVDMNAGLLLVSTFYQGMYLLDTLRGTIDSTFMDPAVMSEFKSALVLYLQRKDRDIFIGTRSNGLYILDEKWEVKERISQREGLLDDAIPFFIFDQVPGGKHALWIAHWQGVSRVEINSPFRYVSAGPGAADMFGSGRDGQITDVIQFNEDFFVSTLDGLQQHQHNFENMRFRPVRRIRGEVYDLQVVEPSQGNEFLLAAGSERTYVFDNRLQITIIPSGGRKLLVDRTDPGVVYLGGDRFRIFHFQNDQWEEALDVGIEGEVIHMCQDRFGLIWIYSRLGLIQLNLQGIGEPDLQYFGTEDGLPSGTFTVFTEPESQELLVGTRNGFFKFDYLLEKFLSDSTYNSILPEGSNNINTIHWGADNLVWFSFENENSDWITLAGRKTGSGFQKVYERFFLTLPPTVPTEVFFTDSEDQLWFSKGSELIHFDESRAVDFQDTLNVLMRNVSISSDSVLFNGTFFIQDATGDLRPYTEQTENTRPKLKHNYRNIAFQWSAPYYQNERQILYTYFLDGFSDDWSEWSPERSAKYTNLPYGKYEMQVKARNVFGDESPVSAYAFSILRPWYANLVALLAYFILITSIVILVILYTRKLRSRAELLEKQNKEIELQKKELEMLNVEITAQRDEIEAQRDSIEEQKELIDRQKNAITDSIQYARRIQDAVLPAKEVMRYLMPKHFVFYQPRDIVSGDFYWVDKLDEKVLIAVADCTGHGVPGAFMSMLGISLLNELSGKFSDLPTNEIMDELRDQLMTALGQTGEKYEAKDGIEMSLVAINPGNREIQFTGANQDLYIFQKEKLTVIEGDRMPVGIHPEGGKPFTVKNVKLNRGDTLYMLTDGYPDQFGGPHRKKFGSSRLRKLLIDMQPSIMHDQGATVKNIYDKWKGDHEQIDDVLMIGIKV